jgi:hypothetical protein
MYPLDFMASLGIFWFTFKYICRLKWFRNFYLFSKSQRLQFISKLVISNSDFPSEVL